MGLSHKDIDALPAGRGMDVLVATRVLGKRLENYCVARPLPFDNGDFDWTLCDRCDRSACVLPRCSTDWTAVREVVDVLPAFYLCRLLDTEERWQCRSAFCGNIRSHVFKSGGEPVCDCRYGEADMPETAVCRAALKWAISKEKAEKEGYHA